MQRSRWILFLTMLNLFLFGQSTGSKLLAAPAAQPVNKSEAKPSSQANPENLLLETTIDFNEKGQAKVAYVAKGSANDILSDKINAALVLYAYVMHHTTDNQRNPLLNQVQRSIQKIATSSGLQRADLITGNSLANTLGKTLAGKGLKIYVSKEVGKGNSIEVKPFENSEEILLPSVFYMFQDLTDNLSENGLRFMVLAMGAMNKCYREIPSCKGENADSVAKAPAYGLDLAVQIISKVTGAEIK